MMDNIFCRRIFAWGVALAMAAAGLAHGAEIVDRVVAVVNDDPIALSDLNRQMKPYAEQIKQRGFSLAKQRKLLFNVRSDVLDQMINQKLTDQELRRYRIRVSEEELDTTIERIKETAFATDEQMRAALDAEGLSYEEYRGKIRDQVLRRKLINSEVRSRIVITKEDIQAHYDGHPELFGGEMKYHLKNLFMVVPEDADEDQKHTIRLQVEGLHQALSRGRAFDALIQELAGNAPEAGGQDLGEFALTTLSPQLRDAVAGKKAGEYTGVLDTAQGFQIFYVENVVETAAKPLETVSESIRDKLFDEIVDKKFETWLEKLRKRSHIKIIQ
jgi:peptidyl-prolyl cis-trans isomerase SurA